MEEYFNIKDWLKKSLLIFRLMLIAYVIISLVISFDLQQSKHHNFGLYLLFCYFLSHTFIELFYFKLRKSLRAINWFKLCVFAGFQLILFPFSLAYIAFAKISPSSPLTICSILLIWSLFGGIVSRLTDAPKRFRLNSKEKGKTKKRYDMGNGYFNPLIIKHFPKEESYKYKGVWHNASIMLISIVIVRSFLSVFNNELIAWYIVIILSLLVMFLMSKFFVSGILYPLYKIRLWEKVNGRPFLCKE